ncbi:MAG: hypothetical protein CML31_15485 [Rhizobiales bacterium]|nr:hypothetical protein [Hyphomicrobiales bacterium]
MSEKPVLPRHPVWPTMLFMTFLALVGAIIWWAATLGVNAGIVISSGPFAWVTGGPALIAAYTMVGLVGAVAVPVWSLGAGLICADHACGAHGSTASTMNITFFSDTHPINKVTQALAERMGLPKVPHVGWYPAEEINAFAMGTSPNNALVALSKGAIERLTKQELIAIIGHELGHVVSGDMARMTLARNVQEGLSFFLLLRGLKTFVRWVFTPLSELELLRMSRAREYVADEISAIMLGSHHMIAALERLRDETLKPEPGRLANVMMWTGFVGPELLSTHPPLERRIERLRGYQLKQQIKDAPRTPVFEPAQ